MGYWFGLIVGCLVAGWFTLFGCGFSWLGYLAVVLVILDGFGVCDDVGCCVDCLVIVIMDLNSVG